MFSVIVLVAIAIIVLVIVLGSSGQPSNAPPRNAAAVPALKPSFKPPQKSNAPSKVQHANRSALVQARTSGQYRPSGDYITIGGFGDVGFLVLPPTPISAPGIRARIEELATPKRLRGGMTNLASGIDLCIKLFQTAPPGAIRKLIIFSDGKANVEGARLLRLGPVLKHLYITVCAVHVGPEGESMAQLQALVNATVGGWALKAGSLPELKACLRKTAPTHASNRRASIFVLCDMSDSMKSGMPGQPGLRRIDAVVEALNDYLDIHAATYGVKVA